MEKKSRSKDSRHVVVIATASMRRSLLQFLWPFMASAVRFPSAEGRFALFMVRQLTCEAAYCFLRLAFLIAVTLFRFSTA